MDVFLVGVRSSDHHYLILRLSSVCQKYYGYKTMQFTGITFLIELKEDSQTKTEMLTYNF